jgi:peptide/nickel transport system permease protein
VRRYLTERILLLPATLLVVSFITFTCLRLAPGNAVQAQIGEGSYTPDQIRVLEDQLGLNDPFLVQYGRWLWAALQGDLGLSYRTGQPVGSDLGSAFLVSAELAVYAIVLAVVIGVVVAALATRFRHSWLDRALMVGSTMFLSLPSFVIGTLLVLAVSLWAPSFGVVGFTPITEDVGENLRSLLLPALSIAVVTGATFAQYIRGSTEDILRSSDYARTAEAKGAPPFRVLLRHVLRNALVPLTTVAGLQLGYLIGGTVVVETIFGLPGAGQLVINSISALDYPMVQGGVLLLAVAFVLVNLGVDLLYPVLDPRVRIHARGA